MKNKIFLACVSFILMETACAPLELKSSMSTKKSPIESIELGSSQDDVVRAMGEPTQKSFDAQNADLVFRYVAKNGERSKEHFVFSGPGKKLSAKYLQIYSDEPEASLKFWKDKYPSSNLSIQEKSIKTKGLIRTFHFVDIDHGNYLEIEKGKVTRIFWKAIAK